MRDDRVAVIDDFVARRNKHGEWVRDVVQQGGVAASQIRSLHLEGGAQRVGSEEGLRLVSSRAASATPAQVLADVNEWVSKGVSDLLKGTTKHLESVLKQPGQIRVVNQSMGASPASMTQQLLDAALRDQSFGRTLAEGLGLRGDVTVKDLAQALASHVDKLFKRDPDIRQAKQRFDQVSQRLERAGILHVVAAGNEGQFLSALQQMGVRTGSSFANSVLFNRQTIGVAASTNNSAQGQIASFSTPSNFVTVAADGTGVRVRGGRMDGTSFAAPQVAAAIDSMYEANPRLTPSAVRKILQQAAMDTSASRQQEGAGILDVAKAVKLARSWPA